MSSLTQLLTSGIGRKVAMAISGLLLVGFLIAHMAGNLLLLVNQEAFNAYSHKLISNPLIYVAEAVLLALFVIHLVNGFIVERRNRAARPVAYGNKQRAGAPSRKSLASTTMIFSGLVALLFVPLHILQFKFGAYYEVAGEPGVRDLAKLVVDTFGSPVQVALYLIALVVLGAHAFHGIGSAFESLGVRHRAWLRNAGRGLALVIFAGFIIIPIAIHFFMGGTS